ncbi:MAG: flagellar hook-length control protein FliK [Dehalococcoidia bacterium]|nr:flagellar hook-length control protein FliK [Dehalococcoidia bacterium]
MTASLAPSLQIGSAPPANAPPGMQTTGATSKTTSTGTGDDAAPGSFAALLQNASQQGAEAQSGGEPATPPTGGPPASESPPSTADLLAQLMALAQGIEANQDGSDPATEKNTNLLLDRLAEAGGTDDQTDDASGVVEALMAYLVMAQPTKAQPDAATAVPDDFAALIQGIEDVLGAAGAEATDALAELASGGAMPLNDTVDVTTPDVPTFEVPADVAVDAADAAQVATGSADAAAETAVDTAAMTDTAAGQSVAQQSPAIPDAPQGKTDAKPATEPVQPATERSASAAAASVRDGATGGNAGDRSDDENGAPRIEARHAGVTQPSHAGPEVAAAVNPPSTPAGPTRVEVVSQAAATAATLPTEVADMVQSASLTGDSELRLVLNPPELGHLDIHITRGEHGLRINIEASQSGARELLDRSMAGLHHALEARDLRVDRLEVRSTDTGRGSMDTSAGGQQSGGGAFNGSQGEDTPEWSPVAMFERMNEPAGQSVPSEQQSVTSTVSTGAGSVDLLA